MLEHQSEFAQPAPATLLSSLLPTHSSPPSDENKMLLFSQRLMIKLPVWPYPDHNYLPSAFQLLPSKNYKSKMQARSLNFLQKPKAPFFFIFAQQLQNSVHHLSLTSSSSSATCFHCQPHSNSPRRNKGEAITQSPRDGRNRRLALLSSGYGG